jgi:hypothetical protein
MTFLCRWADETNIPADDTSAQGYTLAPYTADIPFSFFLADSNGTIKSQMQPMFTMKGNSTEYSSVVNATMKFLKSDNVTAIKALAFYNCEGITSVSIGNGVTTIGNKAFEECNSLKAVHIQDIAAWCNITFAYRGNPLWYARHLYLNGEEVKDLVIPDGVTAISDKAFEKCLSLTSVTIGNSVTSIGASAFANCLSLATIIIGDGVKTIGKSAFARIWKPMKVYCYAEEVPETEEDAFGTITPIDGTLRVPANSISDYKKKVPWKNFDKIWRLTDDELGIDGKEYQDETTVSYYRPDGKQLQSPQRGLNIVRHADGTAKTVVVK